METKLYEISISTYVEVAELTKMEVEYIKALKENKVASDLLIKTKANNVVKASEIMDIQLVEKNTFKINVDGSETIVEAECSIRLMKNILTKCKETLYEENYCLSEIDVLEELLLQNRIKFEIKQNIIELDFF